MSGDVTAGGDLDAASDFDNDDCGHIAHVRAWNDLVGGLTAERSIGAANLSLDPAGVWLGLTNSAIGWRSLG